jgi:hypothetical protein
VMCLTAKNLDGGEKWPWIGLNPANKAT